MSKIQTHLISFFLLFLMFLLSSIGNSWASTGFFDVVSYAISGTGQDKSIDAKLYGALSTARWNDLNGNSDLDGNEVLTESIKVYNRDGRLAVESPNGLNADEVEQWAINNYERILGAIFPSGLSESTGASEDSMMSTMSLSGKMQKVKPKKKKSGGPAVESNNDFKGILEYLSLSVNDEDGHAGSILLGYENEFDGGAEFGILLPYRYTSMDDDVDSESHFVGLSLSGKYPLKKWDNTVWHVGLDVFGSVYYLTSDAIDHAGNFRYGAGVFSSVTQTFDLATLCIGVDYRVSDIEVPSSWIDTDNQFIKRAIDYLNDLDMVSTLSYGFNLGIPLFDEKAAINLEAIRSNFFSDDIPDDRESQTTVGLTFSFYPSDMFELSIGARQTFELEDIDITGVYLGAVFRY